MLRSVDLNYDPVTRGEVCDVWTDGLLSSESDSEPVVAQVAPNQTLGVAHRLTIDPRVSNQPAVSHTGTVARAVVEAMGVFPQGVIPLQLLPGSQHHWGHEQTTTNREARCVMNLAVGIPCPGCGHDVANLLEFVKDDSQVLVAHRLQCVRCETVYLEAREPADYEEDFRLELVLDEAITRS